MLFYLSQFCLNIYELYEDSALQRRITLSKRKTGALRTQEDTRYAYHKKDSQTFYTHESNTINFNQSRVKQNKSVQLVPKSVNQEKYILALLDDNTDIVVVGGPAGTGKTMMACEEAIIGLKQKMLKKIVKKFLFLKKFYF